MQRALEADAPQNPQANKQAIYHIYSNIRQKFVPDLSSKNAGLSYNRAQISKNGANVFVISNAVKICVDWVVQFFVVSSFLFYGAPWDLIYGSIRE
jgi:hypothetical protein